MATTVKRLTYDDLDVIPEERAGDRHEIIDGELLVTPAPIPGHQFSSANIFVPMHMHVAERRLDKVGYAPIDVRLTPDNVLIPDIVFVAHDRLHIIGPRAIDGPPDLVVEILSPGTRHRDLRVKRDFYARFGVQEYWTADPDSRTVQVWALVGGEFQPVPLLPDPAIQSRVLPGFTLALEAVFADD